MTFGTELADAFAVFPPALAVALLALSPVGEVRLAIPVGILAYGMGWAEAFTWALLGNLLVVPLSTWFYPALERLARRAKWMGRAIDRLYDRTRARNEERVLRMKEFAVFGFIAIPVPGTGAWSGVLVAHLFGIPLRQTWRYYYSGIVVACFITTAAVTAGVWGFNQL